MRATLSWRRATGASRRREHGPYLTNISAGVLGQNYGAQNPQKTALAAGRIQALDSISSTDYKNAAPTPNFAFDRGNGATDWNT